MMEKAIAKNRGLVRGLIRSRSLSCHSCCASGLKTLYGKALRSSPPEGITFRNCWRLAGWGDLLVLARVLRVSASRVPVSVTWKCWVNARTLRILEEPLFNLLWFSYCMTELPVSHPANKGMGRNIRGGKTFKRACWIFHDGKRKKIRALMPDVPQSMK